MADFHHHLVLNRWLLGLFNQEDLSAFKIRLGDDRWTGLHEDGQTHFFHQLTNALFHSDGISEMDLRRYDVNIIAHWHSVTQQRNRTEGHTLHLKYFQYLSLLFTEIYLDHFANRRESMLDALNRTLSAYSQEKGAKTLQPYTAVDLNKLAYWNATGSGKTLLMHVNIRQYINYCGEPEQTIVLTPNERLSAQHVDELILSGFNAALFAANSTLFAHDHIKVIDINKLADKHGDKTIAVESLSGRNLVLVDEGHRGTSGNAWLNRREALIDSGFAFEYSATFGQAVAKGKTVLELREEIQKKKAKRLFGRGSFRGLDDAQLAQLCLTAQEESCIRQNALFEVYAKSILFDYSYKYFYADGYGKESLIFNMKDKAYETDHYFYLTACLLSFYQQLYLYERGGSALDQWNLAKPLWVCVGNTTNTENNDINEIVDFLAYFLSHPERIQRWLNALLANKARILDRKDTHIFYNRFIPLCDYLDNEHQLYQDIMRLLFQASSRQRLHLTRLTKADGEIALSVGSSKPFAVINIGDAKKFADNINNDDIDIHINDFDNGLFATINSERSHINLLIGSKKFNEGWSSWRVSTMGLLNIGKSKGSQIIQLFGRGVRLKGRDFSLKRSQAAERPRGLYLDKLETLNIFGVNAGYMEKFKAYLKEEGITPPDEMLMLDFKVRPNLPHTPLTTLRLKDGYKDNQRHGFKRSKYLWLYDIPASWQGKLKRIHTELDRYPRIEAITSKENPTPFAEREHPNLSRLCFPLFDWDAIYRELHAFKLERSYSNLRMDKTRLRHFVETAEDWYTLYCPASELHINSFADVLKQQTLLIELLKGYTERFYNACKGAYEGQFYETTPINTDDAAFATEYQFKIEPNDDGHLYYDKLSTLKKYIDQGELKKALNWQAPNITAICFPAHLYYPIMSLDYSESLPLKMSPIGLKDSSEIRFVKALQQAHCEGNLRQWTGEKSLYLLRNAANKSKGLGFALAGNFYPDFLLWLVDESKPQRQWLAFIDPKGIRQMSLNHPKFGLDREVKKLQSTLGDSAPQLSSFILSVTDTRELINADHISNADLRERHILFMDDENQYLPDLFQLILGDNV